MAFFRRICPCCFGTAENGTYPMQQQAQPGSPLEPTPSHHTLRGTLDSEQSTTTDVGNCAHSVQPPPKDHGSWLKTTTNRPKQDLPLVDLHRNGIPENKTVEGQIASESRGVADGHRSQSRSTTQQLLGPKVAKTDGRDLHLLSIEGRGVCGLSALIILKEVLRQYQYSRKLPQLPRPCDVFDLAGGAGTGGIIAIMLFRLEMTVDEAIVAYAHLCADVFSKPTLLQSQKANSSRLENAIAKVIRTSLDVSEVQGQSMHLLDEERPKCFVISSTAKNMSYPTFFRTYAPPRLASYNCTIVEATRATTAEDPFFPTIDIGDANMKETFIYGGSRINSPVKAVLQEAKSIFPDQSVCCMLSIGSGAQGIIGLEGTSTMNKAQVLKRLMNNDEQISDEVAKESREKDVFTWLNVDHGLEGIGFDDWERLGDVRTHTRKYLEKFDVTQKVSRLVRILCQSTVSTAIAITVKETLTDLGKFMDALTSMLPDGSMDTAISEFIRIAKPSQAATETLNIQCALLRDTLSSCLQGKDVMELPDEVKENVRTLLKGVKKTFNDSLVQENPISYFNTNIRKLLQQFWVKNHIAGNIAVHEILKFIQKDDSIRKTFTRLEQHAMNQNLGNLNVSPFASYDSSEVSDKPSCFKGTRVRFLNDIANWMTSDEPNLAPIYVLDGVAGIGKSTIARTVAEHAAGINLLGASFFFSRDDDKRKTTKTFFPTIAYQLAYYDKVFADGINDALLRAPHVVTQMPIKQFSTLIMEPLGEALAMAGSPILIVVDGLDECEYDGEVVLKIFADFIMKLPRLKIFITTRPEYHIRTILDRYHHLKRFHLQDIEQSVVQSDIRLYLDFHLSDNQVRDKLPELKCSWKPDEKDVGVLIGICGTLFIIASTAVKFILDSKQSDPAKQLSLLLRGVSRRDFSGSKHTTAMDSFYTQILLAAVPGVDKDGGDWFDRYRIVVGTIVALQYPLPRDALSALLHVNDDYVIRTLSHLHSLVAPTGQDQTFRQHHKSFPDFVTSTSRCEQRFLINLKACHLELGKHCLSIMNARLKPNICNLESADRFKDNSFTQHLTQGCVAPELAYASTHWATHLSGAAKLDGEAERLLECFAGKQLLAWLEVLSIIGQMEAAYSSLEKTSKLLGECKTTTGITRELFHDGCRFIALNIELFKVSAGHVFSASAFVPQDTRFFRTYGALKGQHLGVVSGYEKTWNPTISVMRGHEGPARVVSFSPDGTRLASASDDETVRLWDGQTGAEVAVLQGHSEDVNDVVFSPNGTRLASASADRTVRLWDGQTGAQIAVLQGHSDDVNTAVFSPDGTRLASASGDQTVRLWDGQTGAEIAVLQGHTKGVNSVVFSPDGTRLASASGDQTVRLWNGQTGAEIAVLQGHTKGVNSVVFSPDGTRLASASGDQTLRLWDGQTGAEIAVLQGHTDCVNSVVFSPDGTRLASASRDETVRLWDGQTGAEIALLQGHSDWVYSLAFSPDGTRLASASEDKMLRLWDGQTGAEIAVLQGHTIGVDSVVFSPDGTRLASASRDETVRLWDAQTGAEIVVLLGHTKWVNSVAFSPDGTRLASASDDETVRLWDGQTGAEIAVLQGHSDWVNSVAFSPDGTRLASASKDNLLRLWNGQTGAEIAVLQGHTDCVNSVVFSPDGTRLASASDDETVRLWDAQTGAEIVVLLGHTKWVNSVAFSPDGTRLASASGDQTVRLWDDQTDAEIAVLQGHTEWVNSVVFSLDGKRLASASGDETVRLWDGQTGAEIAVLQGHPNSVNSVVFSLDGTRLASASGHQTVQLWDGQTGAKIAIFSGRLLVSYNSNGSGLLLVNYETLYHVGHSIGDELAMPLGLSIAQSGFKPLVVQVPGSNAWIILLKRTQPSLWGLLGVKADEGQVGFVSLCWFPPDLQITNNPKLSVSSLSRAAIACRDGHVLLLDIDLSLVL